MGISAGLVKTAGWTAAGAVAARALPEVVLGPKNTGIQGYAANVVAAVAAAWAAGQFFGAQAGEAVAVGGVTGTILRVVSDNFGKTVPFLRGDPSFRLGLYADSYFSAPTSSDPFGRAANPWPAMLPAAVGMGKVPRYGSRYGV